MGKEVVLNHNIWYNKEKYARSEKYALKRAKRRTAMEIKGLQKLTLLDFPERVACTVFTAGCNFRCPFCHNASLVLAPGEEQTVAEEEFFSFLKKRKGVITGVCVTGGEPTLQKDLLAFLQKIKELGFAVKLDTNGYRPDVLCAAVERGLVDYVAMDVKNALSRYGETVGIANFDIAPIKESVEFLLQGSVPYEFRTTVVKQFHGELEMIELSSFLAGAEKLYLQAFIDSGNLIGSGLSALTKNEMEKMAFLLEKTVKKVELRGV